MNSDSAIQTNKSFHKKYKHLLQLLKLVSNTNLNPDIFADAQRRIKNCFSKGQATMKPPLWIKNNHSTKKRLKSHGA